MKCCVGSHKLTMASFTSFPKGEQRLGIIGSLLLRFPMIALGLGCLLPPTNMKTKPAKTKLKTLSLLRLKMLWAGASVV